MKTKTLLALVAGIIGFAGTTNAALTYTFSIDGDTQYGAAGTLNGTLTLQQISGTNYKASSLFLTSVSNNTSFIFDSSYNYASPGLNSFQSNTFEVDGGEIVYSNFLSNKNSTGAAFDFNANGGWNGTSDSSGHSIWNYNGFSGTAFTADTSAVPEPSAFALLGLGTMGLALRRRR